MKTMKQTNAATSFSAIFAMLLLTNCAAPNGNAVPGWSAVQSSHAALPDKRGQITLFPDTYGDPVPEGITAGPDGALWYIDPGMDVVGRVTTDGQYTMEQRAKNAELSIGITVGFDHHLWFTLEQPAGGLGRMSTSGKVELFGDPGGSFTQGITVGPDHSLWFGESNGTIGRMSKNYKITHFTVAGGNAQMFGITAGPDGNLWVTNPVNGSRVSNQVYRVTPHGKVTPFTVGASPQFICVGPDHALWFAESGANAIGRLTTSGKYSEYPVGNSNGGPIGIASAPDGALWFTEDTLPSRIGRTTTSGKMKFFTVPSSGSVSMIQITPGPDGNMWFAAAFPPAIGRVTVR